MIQKIVFLSISMFIICFQSAFSQTADFNIIGGNVFCVNECVFVENNSSSNQTITSWGWSIAGPVAVNIPTPADELPGSLCFSDEGTYLVSLTFTDAAGVTANADVQVTVTSCPGSINAGFISKTSVCLGECITLTDTSEGDPNSYQWLISPVGIAGFSPGGNQLSNEINPEICFVALTGVDPVTIELTITSADGKVSKATKQINVVPIPTVTATEDTIVDLGNPALIGGTANGATRFRWEPSETVVNPRSINTFAYPIETTDYVITAEDGNGCFSTDTVRVFLNFLPNIGVPSAFSPNGDGKNDLLVVKGLGLEKCIFKVWNRYGTNIFQSTVQKNGWDGNYKGKPATPGVYYWTLEYEFNTGKNGTLSGNTTLVR